MHNEDMDLFAAFSWLMVNAEKPLHTYIGVVYTLIHSLRNIICVRTRFMKRVFVQLRASSIISYSKPSSYQIRSGDQKQAHTHE